MATNLHLISSLLLLFKIQCSTALNDVESLSVKIYDGSTSDTVGTVYLTLWFNFTIYQYTLPATTVGATFTAYQNIKPTFTILGSSDCHLPSYNNIPESKIMIENNNGNTVLIDSIKFNTSSGTWYGFDSVCIHYQSNTYASSWRIMDNECNSFYEHYECICIDNDYNECRPYKQIIYFDTLRPDTYISNAQWSDGTNIYPQIKTCDPTKNPTHFPTIYPTLNPTENPTKSPITTHPTLSPTNMPTQTPITRSPSVYPTKNPTITPTISPTNMPTISPITHAPTYKPTEIPTLTPTNKQHGSVNDNIKTTQKSDESDDNMSLKQSNKLSLPLILIIISVSICLCFCIGILVIYKRRNRNIERAKNIGNVFKNQATHLSEINMIQMDSPTTSANMNIVTNVKHVTPIPNMNSDEQIMEDLTAITDVTAGYDNGYENGVARNGFNTKGCLDKEMVADDTDEGTGTDEDGMEIQHIVQTVGGENSNDYGDNVPTPPPPQPPHDEDIDVLDDIDQRYETVGK